MDDGAQEMAAGEERETPPAPGRPRLRRGLRLLAGLSLLGLLLLAFAVTFLSTPQGATLVRVFLEQWVSATTGGTLRIGELDLRPWKGEATATAVSLRLPGTTLDVQRADVGWWPGAGASVRLLRPVVVVRDTGEAPRESPPATGLAAQPWRILEHVGSAAIVDGRVELRDAEDELWLLLGRLDVETEDAASSRIGVRIGASGVGWPGGGLRVQPVSVEGGLSLFEGALRLDDVRLSAEPSSIALDGRLDRLSPITATVSARVALDGATIGALAPGTDVAGRIEGDVAVEAVEDRVTGTLAVSSPALTVMGVGPWAAKGQGRLAGSQLLLESLSADGYGGRLTAEGPLALGETATTEARVRAEGIDVAALARAFSESGVPVTARADATLRWTTTGWDVDAARGEGEIALRPAPRAKGARAPGVPLAGSGRFRLEGTAVALEGVRVEADGAWLEADVRLSSERALEGAWRAAVPLRSIGALLADIGSEARPPEGYEGTFRAEGDLTGPTSSLEATARVRSEGLSVRGRELAFESDTRYAAGRLALAPLVLRSGRGEARVEGSLPLVDGSGDWDLAGAVEALEVAPLLSLAGLDGRGEATGTLRVAGAREAPAAKTDLQARVTLGPGGVEEVALEITAEAQGTEVRLPRLLAELAGGRLEGDGRFDRETGALAARATASGIDWSRLPLLPDAVRRLGGTLEADVRLGGTLEAPSGDARVALDDATLDGSPLPRLAVEARSDGRRLEIAGRAGDATVLGGGGPLEGDWPLRLEANLAALPVEALLEAFPATRDRLAEPAVRGTLRVDVPLRDLARASYAGTDLAAGGRLGDVEWSIEPFGLEGTADEANVTGLRLRTRATAPARVAARRAETGGDAAVEATLTVDGRVPFAGERPLDLTVAGDVALAALDLALDDSRFDGRASVQAHVGGSFGAPELDGSFGIAGGRVRAEGVRVSNLEASGRFQGREAHVDAFTARVLGGEVVASGSFPVAPLEPGRSARLRFEARDLDLARLAGGAGQRTDETPSFFFSAAGEVEATAPALDGLRAEGRITRFESKTTEGTIGLDSPAAWRIADGRLEQDPIRVRGPLGTLEASASIALTGAGGGSVVLTGPFDLRIVSPFVPDTTLAGAARADLRARWDASGTALEGLLAVDDGRLTLETLSFNASRLEGEVRFLGDRAEVDATAAAGDGRLVAYGSLHFGERLLGEAALAIEADRIPITYPEGFRGRATGGILVEGDAGRYRVSGLIDMTQGYYTAEFDQRRESLDQLDYQIAALRGESLADSLPLAVDVRLKDPLRLRNSQAQLDIVGTVTASGTLAQPAVTGQVSLLEGGRLTVRRARIRAQSGRVELNGYPAGVPEVEFEGQTQVGGVSMNLRAQGVMDDLQLDISSSNRPDLGQSDLVSLLLTGRTAQAAAAESGALVAEELAAALGGALQKGVGDVFLIDVSSDESALLDDSDPTQRFSIGTRLSRTLAVLYSTRLDGTGQRSVLEWKPRAGRITFRAIDDREEGQILELSDRFSFNVVPRRGAGGVSLKLQRLGAVRFEGELPLPEKDLRRATRVRNGRRYDPLAFAQAADGVRRKLVEAGWRGASVDEAVEPMPGRKGRVELVLKVDAGPKVVLSWRGDEPGKKVRKRALEAWPPYASPEAAATAVARAARVQLQAERFYEARVAHQVTVADGRAELVLTVDRGPQGRRVVVEFDGNSELGDEELADTLPKPGSHAFFDALDRPARLFTEARVAYAGIGYMRARLGPARPSFDAASGQLTVSVRVRERAPSRVAEVVVPSEFAEGGASRPALKLAVGQPFDVQAYVADRDAIAAWYRREGWMEARVRGVLEPSGGDVRVTYAADPGPRPRLGEIRITSSGRTMESLVRHAIQNEPGEIILPLKLAETRTRLSELNVFSSIDVRTVPADGGGDDVRDLDVSYVERPDVELEYGLRYDASGVGTPGGAPDAPSEGELQLAAALRLPNPFGLGWSFNAYTLQTTARQNYRLGLQASTIFGLRVKTQLLAFDESDDDSAIAESFASRVKGFAVQQSRVLLRDTTGRRWHDRLRLQWGYTNKDIRYSEQIGSPDIVAGNRAFLSLSLIGDQRNSLTDPSRGLFWTATTEWSRRFLGSDVDYVRLYGQLFTYLPLVKGLVWAQGLRAGVVPGDDPLLLLENRFQAGGPTTVRGFRQNGLGPQLTEDEGLGGQGVFVMNQEVRFPIWKMLKGGVFWDSGNSWLWAHEFSLRDLRHTVGGGLRIMFPFGPVRLEYGFILDRRKNSDGSYVEPRGRFVFGLGHAF